MNNVASVMLERSCARCMYAEILPPPPGQIIRARICRWGPKSQTQQLLPDGRLATMANYPTVTDQDWCYQFKELQAPIN